jgi:Ca2+/H+ antiporter, TMEM165/GDT1 family
MTFVLTMAAAAAAVGVEMLEALAIVLAVGLARGFGDAMLGALAAVVAVVLLCLALGPGLLGGADLHFLRVIVGSLLLLFGLEWLRKGILRMAGRRPRSSSYDEFVVEREALGGAPGRLAPALLGAAVALVLVVAIGLIAHQPLRRLPETQLKLGVGVALTAFGTFFAAEGLRVEWPLGDVALIYLAGAFAITAWVAIRLMARDVPAAEAA